MGDFGATPALVTLAPRSAVRGVTLSVHGGRSNSIAPGQWLLAGEPVGELADGGAVVARGRRERVTDPACSLEYALQARPLMGRLCRFEIGGSGHATLERFFVWQRRGREVVLASLGAWPWSARVHRAFALPGAQACRVEL